MELLLPLCFMSYVYNFHIKYELIIVAHKTVAIPVDIPRLLAGLCSPDSEPISKSFHYYLLPLIVICMQFLFIIFLYPIPYTGPRSMNSEQLTLNCGGTASLALIGIFITRI